MKEKDYLAMLMDKKDMPKIVDVSDENTIKRYGKTMLICPPMDYCDVLKKIPYGEIRTINYVRSALAYKYDASFTDPITAGLFMNICAMATITHPELEIPFWRVVKTDYSLNDKHSEILEYQKNKLIEEGHEIIDDGRKVTIKLS